MEVINEDYSDYVSLSGRLVNVDGSVMRMRKPLVELKVSTGAQGGTGGGGGVSIAAQGEGGGDTRSARGFRGMEGGCRAWRFTLWCGGLNGEDG